MSVSPGNPLRRPTPARTASVSVGAPGKLLGSAGCAVPPGQTKPIVAAEAATGRRQGSQLRILHAVWSQYQTKPISSDFGPKTGGRRKQSQSAGRGPANPKCETSPKLQCSKRRRWPCQRRAKQTQSLYMLGLRTCGALHIGCGRSRGRSTANWAGFGRSRQIRDPRYASRDTRQPCGQRAKQSQSATFGYTVGDPGAGLWRTWGSPGDFWVPSGSRLLYGGLIAG